MGGSEKAAFDGNVEMEASLEFFGRRFGVGFDGSRGGTGGSGGGSCVEIRGRKDPVGQNPGARGSVTTSGEDDEGVMGVAQCGSEMAPNAAETTVENDGYGNAEAGIMGNRLVAWPRGKGGSF